MNPHSSPWNKQRPKWISDQKLWFRWNAIEKHLTSKPDIDDQNDMLTIRSNNKVFFLAKNSQKMRLKSHLDWCYYTPLTLAQAIDNDQVEAYYEFMLSHPQSDPNDWKDSQYELDLKSFYAARAKRASLI
jgi:hypothetical protein